MKYVKKVEKILELNFGYFYGEETKVQRYDDNDKYIVVIKKYFAGYDEVDSRIFCKIHFLIELNNNNIISSLEDIREEIIKEANTIIANYNQEYVSVYYINDEIEIKKTDIIRQKLHAYTYKNIYTEDEKIIKERQIAAINRKVSNLEEKLIKKCSELANNLRECSEQEKALEEHINSSTLDIFKNFNKKKINDIKEKINKISNERDELLNKINI